jgi:glucokinase
MVFRAGKRYADSMILAGDIGGTKTVLGLFYTDRDVAAGVLHETRFESAGYSSLEAIIAEFLRDTKATPTAASFGVAGPVRDQRAQITNLPWEISAEVIRSSFGIPEVFLLNDLESIATAIPHLDKDDFDTLNTGVAVPHGNIAVIAPGTGLGTAFLVWTGHNYKACASEGGHASFSPRTLQEMELLKYLKKRYEHVSFERICSGSHLPNIYDFFMARRTHMEPKWLREALARAADRTPVIVQAALEKKADICEATLDLFVSVLGTVVGNLAVTLLPTGGIYLAGGIPSHIFSRLQQADFLSAVSEKGRFSELCSKIPIHIIRNPGVALRGAAWFGLQAMTRSAR